MADWLTARPIAHRGLHDEASGTIENTPSAFRAAIAAGYSIECDLQVSSDGEAMVHHDDALGRLTDGAGRLDAMTAAGLRGVAFRMSTDRMLTLGELCDLTAGRATLVIELKGFRADDRLARRVAAVLASYRGPAAVMSFDPALIATMRRLAPSLRRGMVGMRRGAAAPTAQASPLPSVRQALEARPQFLAYRVADLATPLARLVRGVLRLPLLTWTVRTAEERAQAARYADQMIFEGFRP